MWPALGKASTCLSLEKEALGEDAVVSVCAKRLLAPVLEVLQGLEAAGLSRGSIDRKAQPQWKLEPQGERE